MSPNRLPKRREHMPRDLAAMHNHAEQVTCPYCGATPGQPCINPTSGDPRHTPCEARRKAAEEAQ